MKAKNIKTYYRQNLPHIQPLGAAFFVTFRLKDSIPSVKLFQLRKEYEASIANIQGESSALEKKFMCENRKRFFAAYDRLLDDAQAGPHYLKQPEIAQLVEKELHRFDGDFYDLVCYCIMSNHVHILIDTSLQVPEGLEYDDFETMEFEPLQNIMKRIKGPTAIYANRLLNRSGKFWQRESYDHYVRNEKEFQNIITYILENPVKAKLVEEWKEYPFSYLRQDDIEPVN